MIVINIKGKYTYERTGSDRNKLILTDDKGETTELEIVELDEKTLRFRGKMDGNFIDFIFSKQ